MNIKNYIKKYAFLVILLAMIVFAANISKKTSSLTLTRYKSSVTGSDTSRVAKWEIKTLSSSGETNNFDLGFRTSILDKDDNGYWAFEICNSSEVDGEIDENSYIRIRLDNESYNILSSDTINWNFINETANPLSFNLYAYKGKLNDILMYEYNDLSITYDEYIVLDNKEKKNYTLKQINASNSLIIIDTISNDKNQTFQKAYEDLDSKRVYYYYLDIKLGDNIKNILSLPTVGSSPDNTISFIIDWNVDVDYENTSTNESSNTNNTYYIYEISESIPMGYEETTLKSFKDSVANTTYYIYQKSLNYFDYTLYTSALTGGEPSFEFKSSNEFDVLKVKYSALSKDQITTIYGDENGDETGYKNISIDNYVDLKHYKEYLEFVQYKEYLKYSKSQQEALGYLSYGLKVNIQFNVCVKQTEPTVN